ncbi:MAG: hypothetical protein AABX48_03475 [Nanoarchaeota archaeon]
MGPKISLVEALKEAGVEIPTKTFTIKLDAPFPSEEEVMTDFWEQNLIGGQKRLIGTHKGNIYIGKDYTLLFTKIPTHFGNYLDYLSKMQIENSIHPSFGGIRDGSKYKERTYSLSGELHKQKISLTAVASESQRYIFHESTNITERGWKESGEPIFRIERKDNSSLWFLTVPKTKTIN